MPLTISLQCPHCGHASNTTRLIPPGANIRCPRCKGVFQVTPSDGELVETIPLAGEEERATTAIEMLSPDQGPMPVARSAQRERRDAMAPATPRAPAPVPQAPKKLPLSGEPLPFHRSRKLMAIDASIMVLGADSRSQSEWPILRHRLAAALPGGHHPSPAARQKPTGS